MPNIRISQHSFAGGEISPEMLGRIDDGKYQSGLATCRNFIIKPQGPAENRPGFAFVRAVKDSTKRTRLIPFTYSTTQTMVIELGAGYFRFHTLGGTLMTDGTVETFLSVKTPYEVANPFAEADLFDVHYVQSADVLTLVHPNYAPRELRRLGLTNWVLSTITFAPDIDSPLAPTVVATRASSPTNLRDYFYVVTAVKSDGLNESVASGPGQTDITNNLLQSGAYNTISWDTVAGAARYNVYKQENGLYGYIGQTEDQVFKDENIASDLSKTPPINDSVFPGAGDYPGAVSYFEQRRCFAGTANKPQNIWMTRPGTESSMNYSLPVRDDDRIAFRVAAREANTIRHIVPLSQLLLLTSAAEWRVTSVNSDAITPSTISVRPQSYVGASNVQPVIINNSLLYGAARGGHVRELGYNWQAQGFVTGDLSLRAAHLFDGADIVDATYVKAPQPLVWFVSSSGKLLGLTYVPEQQVGAWHQHDTDGVFESCASVAEGGEDRLYCVVWRTINGVQKRYIERLAGRQFVAQADAFFVDAGATYSGAPATNIGGLAHLEGKVVNILADGAVHPQRVVAGGAVTLDQAASKVHIGLPITADLQTLPIAAQVDGGFAQGRVKAVNKVWLRVYRSSGIFVGPGFDKLTEAKQRTTEPYGSPPALKSDEIQVMLPNAWDDGAQVVVRQSAPLPLTVLRITAEVALGG